MLKAKPRAGELTTANYGWVKPTVGASNDAWGGYINADLDGIDSTVHGIQTSIPTVPSASATQPVMDGAATAGSSTQWSRGDHVHPTDTSRASVASVPVASSTTPAMNGAAAVGTGTTWARADHVHPTDTTRAPLTGVNNGSNAAAGQVGECIIVNQTTNVPLTNQVITNIATVSLTAGDWDVDGAIGFSFSIAGLGGLSNISTVSASFPATYAGSGGFTLTGSGAAIVGSITASTNRFRVSVAVTTPVYLVGEAYFLTGTCNAQGTIMARRVR